MSHNHEKMAAQLAGKEGLVDMLDMMLRPGDQAWIVCSFPDCAPHLEGRCRIHTIAAPPTFINGQPCESYEKRA